MFKYFLIFLVFFGACSYSEFPPPPVPQEYAESSEESTLSTPSVADLAYGREKPLSYDEMEDKLADSGKNWFYGAGLGKTIGNIGACVAFPPYIAYLVGNAGLSLAGYDPVYVTDILPTEGEREVQKVYDAVTSVPGLVAAKIAGEKFNSPESLR